MASRGYFQTYVPRAEGQPLFPHESIEETVPLW